MKVSLDKLISSVTAGAVNRLGSDTSFALSIRFKIGDFIKKSSGYLENFNNVKNDSMSKYGIKPGQQLNRDQDPETFDKYIEFEKEIADFVKSEECEFADFEIKKSEVDEKTLLSGNDFAALDYLIKD